jgi:hypothetical protein
MGRRGWKTPAIGNNQPWDWKTPALEFGYFPVGAGLKPALTPSFFTPTFCLTSPPPPTGGFETRPYEFIKYFT